MLKRQRRHMWKKQSRKIRKKKLAKQWAKKTAIKNPEETYSGNIGKDNIWKKHSEENRANIGRQIRMTCSKIGNKNRQETIGKQDRTSRKEDKENICRKCREEHRECMEEDQGIGLGRIICKTYGPLSLLTAKDSCSRLPQVATDCIPCIGPMLGNAVSARFRWGSAETWPEETTVPCLKIVDGSPHRFDGQV